MTGQTTPRAAVLACVYSADRRETLRAALCGMTRDECRAWAEANCPKGGVVTVDGPGWHIVEASVLAEDAVSFRDLEAAP